MRVVRTGEFDGTRAELEAAVATYRQQIEDHKGTVGVPAPWPDYEILRVLVRLPPEQWALENEIIEEPGEEPRHKPKAPPPGSSAEVLRQALIDAGIFEP